MYHRFGLTGSVATVKIFDILECLEKKAEEEMTEKLHIQLVATTSATKFFNVEDLSLKYQLHLDEIEWSRWKQKGDPISHIYLRDWADVFCIVPLDANTLAKIAHGLCDNLLTCIARAWPTTRMSKFAVFPAMNTFMWEHPITESQLQTLRTWGIKIASPVCKQLACGDFGMGALPTAEHITKEILFLLKQ